MPSGEVFITATIGVATIRVGLHINDPLPEPAPRVEEQNVEEEGNELPVRTASLKLIRWSSLLTTSRFPL